MNSILNVLESSFTSVQADIFTALGTILPIVLAVVGAGVVIGIGIKYFKKTRQAS